MDRIVIKIVLLGHESKSQLRRSYFGENFNFDMKTIIGSDFAVKYVYLDEEVMIEYQIWDVHTAEEFKNIRKKFYHGLSVVILVFDGSDEKSLGDLYKWFDGEICDIMTCNKLPVILLSNKIKSGDDSINEAKITNFINQINIKYDILINHFHTSISDGENIEKCFEELSRSIYDNLVIKI